MKRGVSRVLALMCAVLLGLGTARAAGTTYDLEELHLSLEFPADCDVLTRDTPANDPIYARYGFAKKEIDALLEAGNAYLNALWSDGFKEIVVTMVDNPLEDFGQLSDAALSVIISSIEMAAEENGMIDAEMELYQHAQVKFIKVSYSKNYDNQLVYSVQYYTVCDKKAINITLNSYNGKVTQADQDKLRGIVDSANFQNAKPVTNPGSGTGPFAYTDTETGISFTVPANWTQKELSQARDTIKAKFVSTREEGLTILYGNVDLWSQLPASEKLGRSRAELNNDVFTPADVKDMAAEFGLKDASTSSVNYGGKQYFLLEGESSSQVAGMSVQIPMTVAMRLENGYMVQFQFMGKSDSPYFEDFTQLLESVRYPEESVAPPVYLPPTVPAPPSPSSASGASVGILCAVAAIGVLAIVLIAKKSRAVEKARPQAAQEDSWTLDELVAQAEGNASPTQQELEGKEEPRGGVDAREADDTELPAQDEGGQDEPGDQPMIRFCHRCGKELAAGSAICGSCGAQIPEMREEDGT